VSYSKNTWDQLRNTTAQEIIKALEKDGWSRDESSSGAILVYYKTPNQRTTIHYHPKKTYGAKFLKGLISDIGWDEDDLKRLKLIK